MSKAERRALEVYPVTISEYSDSCRRYDSNESDRLTFLEGYHQAEKDNELTWDDIHAIAIIEDKLIHELCLNDQTLPTTQEFYEEVLKRFKAKKVESC